MEEKIKKGITVLQQGGIVIYPTDTAFGIGCRIDNHEAIKRLFTLRKRPESQATPVLVDGVAMAKKYLVEIPERVDKELIAYYWPGALTVILPCQEGISPLVRGGTPTLGVRMPNHPTVLSLISGTGVPILGPSANFHGEATPYTFEDLNPELVKLVDYVLPGECNVKLASTVVDCTRDPWKIIRKGAVTISL